jgi:hypothetical protein
MKQFTTKESVAQAIKDKENRIVSLNAKGVQNMNLVKKAERQLRALKEIEKSF